MERFALSQDAVGKVAASEDDPHDREVDLMFQVDGVVAERREEKQG